MKESDVKRYVRRITKPIFDKVLQETDKGCMTPPPHYLKVLWRPNNYRRRMRIIRPKLLLHEIRRRTLPFHMESCNNHIFIKDFMGVTLQVGRYTITGIYSQKVKNGVKETYLIEGKTIKEVEDKLFSRKDLIKGLIDKAMRSFCRSFKIVTGIIKWSRYEDWVKGEEFIDKLPRDMIIHDTVFKKVYGEGVEFKKVGDEEPVTHVKNYIKNRAVEDASKLAFEQLQNIKESYEKIMDLLERQAECSLNTAQSLELVVKYLEPKGFKKDLKVVGVPDYVG